MLVLLLQTSWKAQPKKLCYHIFRSLVKSCASSFKMEYLLLKKMQLQLSRQRLSKPKKPSFPTSKKHSVSLLVSSTNSINLSTSSSEVKLLKLLRLSVLELVKMHSSLLQTTWLQSCSKSKRLNSRKRTPREFTCWAHGSEFVCLWRLSLHRT